MSWIETISPANASSDLKRLYDRVSGPDQNVDNVLLIHSLRPHTLLGHMTLYKAVLHNSNNTFPKWYLEVAGTYVSHLNRCNYCVQHHFSGLKRLLDDGDRAEKIWQAIQQDDFRDVLDEKQRAGLDYARKLTLDLHGIVEADVLALRASGFDDGEILELNQVTSYFNYVNRSVLGLGVNTEGDVLGLSPNNSGDPASWEHR